MTIGFLYSEVMGYTEACFQELLRRNVKLIVVCWDVNLKTPYKLKLKHNNLIVVRSSTIGYKECIALFLTERVDGIYVSGWMDRKYLSVARYFKKSRIKVIGGCDTYWDGSLKHHFAAIFGRFWLRSYFSELLVAGAYQFEFARRIGFKTSEISWPEYSCDTDLFTKVFLRNRQKPIERVLVFVGRFSEVKGVLPLVNAFLAIKKDDPNNSWKLKLIGNGPLREIILESASVSPDILIRDFLQPHELADEIQFTGVFCLPSIIEPWGVAAHEFAVAGFPLILSETCGSSFHFLKDGYNGYLINPGHPDSIVRAMRKIMECDDETLNEFSTRSHELGVQLNPTLWAGNFLSRFR